MDKFYVYVYLDPRKPGIFKYDNLTFDYEPFYIGKGSGRRAIHGFDDKCKSFKINKIKSIIKNGHKPIVIKIHEGLSEQDSFDKEKLYIKNIGRHDLGKGPLTNLTDGGDGPSGYKPSPELIASTRQKIKEHYEKYPEKREEARIRSRKLNIGEKNPMYGRHHTAETKKILSKLFTGRINGPLSQEVKDKISSANKGKVRTAETIERCRKSHTGKKHSEETKQKISSANRGKARTSEWIANLKNAAYKRKVAQYDIAGNFIMEYESVRKAAEQTNVYRTSISSCLNGRMKQAGNFIWKYV